MVIMAETFTISPVCHVISNGFGCSNNQETRIKPFLYLNSKLHKGIIPLVINTRLVISNGFECSNNKQSSIKSFVYMNSKLEKPFIPHVINTRVVNSDSVLQGVGIGKLFGGYSTKSRKYVNFRLMVVKMEHGFVLDSCIEGSREDEEKEEKPLLRNRNLGGDLECRSGNLKKSLMVSKGGENKVIYLEERDEEVLSKRILNLSRTNRRTSALVLFRSMEVSGLRPSLHACNSLLASFSRSNMVDDMLRIFAFMKSNKILSGHSCSLVLIAVANNGGSDTALKMFLQWDVESEMKQHFDSVVYNTMISICGKENNWVQIKEVWKSMKENGIIGTTITYRVLVCTFVRCGQYETAIDAYLELLHNELEPGSDAMQAVVGACAKEENWEMALSVFHNMLKCGLKPNLISCNALINVLGKAGKVKEAYKVYKQIRELGHLPDSYTWNSLLSAFYRANQNISALQLFDSIQKDSNFAPSLYLYNTVLMCCQRLRYWEKALQYLWEMEKSGLTVSTESYNLVINVCESARKPKVALQIYEHMVYKECLPDTFTRLSLLRSCIWGDLWEEVDNILDESKPNVSLYNAAIQGMCFRRKFESAKKLYIKMRDIGLVPDGKTRALMLQYMRRKS